MWQKTKPQKNNVTKYKTEKFKCDKMQNYRIKIPHSGCFAFGAKLILLRGLMKAF